MKLAEALSIRSDLQKDIAALKSRVLNNAQQKQGGRPSEQPHRLVERLNAAADELQVLIQRINRTNANTEFEPGMTLADALVVRDILKIKHNVCNELANAATINYTSMYRSEMLMELEGTVEVPEVRKEAYALARAFRKLDMSIQEKNWQVDVID